ncbi:MAG: HD domain-containing protein [Armatimonadetes bacterium]|nr:HD domain-containing protein [Armatimonadota bacterium]
MGRISKPPWWKQFLLLALTFMVVGSGATVVLYGQSVATVKDAARGQLLNTAHLAALQIDADKHSSLTEPKDTATEIYRTQIDSLVRMVGSVSDIERIYTVRQNDSGIFSILTASRTLRSTETEQTFLQSMSALPAKSGAAWLKGVTVIDDDLVESGGNAVDRAYVPLIRSDGSVEALLVVDRNYRAVQHSLDRLKSGLWLGLGAALLFATLFSWTLTHVGKENRSMIGGGITFHRNRRIWITIGLLLASAAILSDGAVGYLLLKVAGEGARSASQGLQQSRDLEHLVAGEQVPGWASSMNQAAEFYDGSGQPWMSIQILAYKDAVLSNSPNAADMRARLLQATRQDVARIQGDLGEASGRIQAENSHQTVRLVMTVAIGLIALVLMGAVSAQEKRLEDALDENTKVQREYESLVGNLPIGLFAYLNGKVLFTNGAWGNRFPKEPQAVFSSVHEEDRGAFLRALEQAGQDYKPFSATIRLMRSDEATHFEAYCAPVVNRDGHLRHLLVFCVDVSPLVKAKIEIQRKHRQVEDKNYQLGAALKQVEASLHTAVGTMIRAVEVKDPYTAGHSERVRQYSVWMGENLGLTVKDLKTLSHGARIHDVGKIGIPDEILTKPGRLTKEEYEAIKQHTITGAKIVGDIEMFRDCVPIVRWHHERLDGSGYPDGLAGDEIPFLVRLVSVADMFDAMTSNRSYRQGLSAVEALTIMARDVTNGKLDIRSFDAIRMVISEKGMIPQVDAGESSAAA